MQTFEVELPGGGLLNIRPFEFTDEDYERHVQVLNSDWPDMPTTAEEIRRRDERRDQKYFLQRVLAEVGGRVVAGGTCCEPEWSYQPGKYFLIYFLRSDHEGMGIDAPLLEHLIGIAVGRGATLLYSTTRDQQQARIQLLLDRGFTEVKREVYSSLDLSTFDPTPFVPVLRRVRDLGIDIRTVADLEKAGIEWKRPLWDVHWVLLQDTPDGDTLTREPFERFVRRTEEGDRFVADGYFIALDGGRMIGLSHLCPRGADPETLSTGLTGVLREYRRNGIATALKVAGIVWARKRGAKRIRTDNDQDNPMLQLNLELGFRPRYAWVDFTKRLGA
jgi:mycothiol synthase